MKFFLKKNQKFVTQKSNCGQKNPGQFLNGSFSKDKNAIFFSHIFGFMNFQIGKYDFVKIDFHI